MVVLSPAIVRGGFQGYRAAFNLSTDKQGFFMERHPKLAPLSTCRRIFIPVSVRGLKIFPILYSGFRAAAEALTIVVNDKMELEATTAMVNRNRAAVARLCRVCHYGAPAFNYEKRVSEINELCARVAALRVRLSVISDYCPSFHQRQVLLRWKAS